MNDVLTIHEYTFEGLESFLLELDLSLILRKDLEHLLEILLFFLTDNRLCLMRSDKFLP